MDDNLKNKVREECEALSAYLHSRKINVDIAINAVMNLFTASLLQVGMDDDEIDAIFAKMKDQMKRFKESEKK